ncbi:MAG: ABC transporter substrate binding protein [Burkholderiales bacterium]
MLVPDSTAPGGAACKIRLLADLPPRCTPASLAAKKATSTIPIVMGSITDPVGSGMVASLARPGGNVTGLPNLLADVGQKHLEMLLTVVPGLSRVAVSELSWPFWPRSTACRRFFRIANTSRPAV